MCLDASRPAEYVCSLYRLQNRWRKGDAATRRWAENRLPLLDTKCELPPSLRLILHQTHLLLNPIWQTAWQVLESVITIGSIHVFVTPHWAYRALTIIINEDWNKFHPEDVIHLYSNALVVLETSSWKWESGSALAGSLENLMQQKRRKTKGSLWDKTYTINDVRI